MSSIFTRKNALVGLETFFLVALAARILISGRIYYWSNYLFLLCFSLIYILALAIKKSFFPMGNPLKAGLLLFFGATIISMAFGIHPLLSARELIIFLAYLFLFLAALEIYSLRNFAAAVWVVFLAALVQSLFGLDQYFGGLERSINLGGDPALGLFEQVQLKRIFGLTFSPDFFACLLASSLAVALAGWKELTSKFNMSGPARSASLIVFSLLMLVPMILSRSMGSFLSFCIGILCLLAVKFRGRLPARKVLPALFFLIVIACSVIASFAYHRRSMISSPENNPVLQRLYNFRGGLAICKEKPVFGVGVGNFWIAYPKYRPELGNETRYAHNNFIQVLAESGPLAEIGLLILVVLALLSIRKIDPSRNALGLGLWAGLVVICSHWLWDYGLYVPELASVFLVFFAGLLAMTAENREQKASVSVSVLAGLLLVVIWFVSIWIFAEQRTVKHAEEYLHKGEIAQAKAGAEKAIRMIPGDDYPEIIIAWVTARTGEKPSVVESYFQKAIQLNPRFAFWHKDFGDYYVNIDKIKPAEDEYRKALALYPNNPDFMAMVAKVRRYQGDLKDAEDMTNKAMAVSGNHQNVLWEMFYIKSDQGDHQRAKYILQQLVWAYQDQSAKMMLQRMRAEPQK